MNTCLLGYAPVTDCTLTCTHPMHQFTYHVSAYLIFGIKFFDVFLWSFLIYSNNESLYQSICTKTSLNFLSFTYNVKLKVKVNPALFRLFTISLFTTLTWMFLEISLDQVVHYVVLVNSIHCHSALKIKPREHLVHLRYVICQNNWVLHQKVIRDLGTYRGALWGSLHPVRVTACTECMHTGL